MMNLSFLRKKYWGLWGILLWITVPALALDWPNFRGPNYDNVSHENIRTNWQAEPPALVWKISIDPGLSSFAVAAGKAFTQVRRAGGIADQEVCVALDALTGGELWATPVGIADYPEGGVGSDDGPRSTPSVSGGQVFVLSSYLNLVCLDAATGAKLWNHDLPAEFGSTVIPWQNAASPLVEGDLVIVNGNAPNACLMAFRKSDGALAWKVQNDPMTQASPVAATIGGARQIIFFAQSGLVSVAAGTGAVLWRNPLTYNGVSVAASPVVIEDKVYCSRAYPGPLARAQAGAVVVQITGSDDGLKVNNVWSKVNQLMNHWATPVAQNGYVFGMFGQGSLTFKCVELASGSEKWSRTGFGYGNAMAVDGNILATTDSGVLILVAPDPTGYTELVRFQAVTGKCWNFPVVSNGRIFIRSTTEAACLDVAAKVLAPLKLQPLAVGGTGDFRFAVSAADHSALDTNRASKVTIFVTSDLLTDPMRWLKLNLPGVFKDGQLLWDDSGASTNRQRFYRAQEGP